MKFFDCFLVQILTRLSVEFLQEAFELELELLWYRLSVKLFKRFSWNGFGISVSIFYEIES